MILNHHLTRMILFAFKVGPVRVRRFIVNNLARRDRTVAETIVSLAIHDQNLGIRLAALAVVGHYHHLQDLDILAIALRDPHEAVRATAAHLLGQSRLAFAGHYLQPALVDSSPAVRAAAVQSLGLIRSEESAMVLQKALEDKDLQVRGNAAWALGRLGGAGALVPLQVMAARDPIYKNRELAQQAGLKIRRRTAPEPEKRQLLRAEVAGYILDQIHSSAERRRVKNALIYLGGESLIPLLDQALEKTNDAKIHLDIVEILVTLPSGKQLQNILIRCIHHISSPVRRLAIIALGDIGDREAIFFLGKVAHEGQQPNQLLNLEDTRLALEAIEKINQRTS